MLEALYNITLLAEVGILAYGYGKLFLDLMWSFALRVIIQFGLLEISEINELWNYINRV